MGNFGFEIDPAGILTLFSSDGVTTSEVDTDITAKGTPCKVEYDIERGNLKLYALINDVWILKATQISNVPTLKEIFGELTETVEKLTNELNIERKGKKKIKLQEVKLNLGLASFKFGRD